MQKVSAYKVRFNHDGGHTAATIMRSGFRRSEKQLRNILQSSGFKRVQIVSVRRSTF